MDFNNDYCDSNQFNCKYKSKPIINKFIYFNGIVDKVDTNQYNTKVYVKINKDIKNLLKEYNIKSFWFIKLNRIST